MSNNPSGTVLYTTAENNLHTAVFEFPEYASSNRSVNAVSTWGGYQEGAWKADVKINTGYIPNWILLSNTEKKRVIFERNNQGVKLGDGKGSNTGN